MASGLSKRPRRLEVVAEDDDLPSSVHKVLSNDDLLMEILLWLPVLSLHLFKLVCKQWMSLITSSSFTLTRSRIPPVDPPSGLFISDRFHRLYDFLSFDPIIPQNRSIHPSVRRIEQSCNGLLLCSIDASKNKYVCNSSFSMFKMLPKIHGYLSYENDVYEGMMNIAFDPTKSPCYKVVHVGSEEDDDDDYSIRMQIYSSETGDWSVSDDCFSDLYFDRFSEGIYWNDAIHWLNPYEPFHVKLDIMDRPILTKIQTPIPLTVNGHVHVDRKLFKSHDSLLLLCKDYEWSRNLNIYEMKSDNLVWSVKYYVKLDNMMKLNPTWRMPANWSCSDILSIVLGERGEDSFMVIELSGKILQYKFGLETVSELFDLDLEMGEHGRCFEYIASFAHV